MDPEAMSMGDRCHLAPEVIRLARRGPHVEPRDEQASGRRSHHTTAAFRIIDRMVDPADRSRSERRQARQPRRLTTMERRRRREERRRRHRTIRPAHRCPLIALRGQPREVGIVDLEPRQTGPGRLEPHRCIEQPCAGEQGHLSVVGEVPGLEHLRHAVSAQQPDDLVVTKELDRRTERVTERAGLEAADDPVGDRQLRRHCPFESSRRASTRPEGSAPR